MLNPLLHGLRPVVRSLTRSPGFTLFVILTFALGIGSTTAIYSVADAFIFKPLPFPRADQLVMLHERAPGDTTLPSAVSPADYLDFERRSSSFQQIAAYQQVDYNISDTGGDPDTVYSTVASANFFDTLGAKPLLGRTFAPGEDAPGNNVAVLSYGLWQRRFAGDVNIVGRQIKLNGSTYAVIGVMSKNLHFPLGGELWVPLVLSPRDQATRDYRYLRLVARLKNGVTETQARAELGTIATLLASVYPQSNHGWSTMVQPLHRYVTGEFNRQYTVLLLFAVFFLLLIVCANIMSLQFARISSRNKEFGVRAALGASRWRILRQILAESTILALAGGVASLLFSAWSLSLILSNMPADVARYIAGWDEIRLDARALGFTLAVTVFAGVLSGILPALRTRPDVNDALKEGSRGSSSGKSRLRSRAVLVVAQLSAAMVLLVGAGLILTNSRSLLETNQNLRPNSLLTMQIVLSDKGGYSEASQRAAFYDRMLQRLAALPGVEHAALVSNPPYGYNERTLGYEIEGQPAASASEQKFAQLLSISPNYLEAFRIPLLRGREFKASDGLNSPAVAIVSENFARRNWPRGDAVGRHVRLGKSGEWLTVVGIVKDVRYDPWATQPAPAIYQPYPQAPLYYTYVALRAKGDPEALAMPARRVIAALDIDRPLWEIKTLDRVIANRIIGLSYVAAILAVLGTIAIVLSTAGIYALMAFIVSERTREIGIRLALGASRPDVLRVVARRGFYLTLTGLTIGSAISFALTRLLSNRLVGVSGNGFITLGATALLLACAALVASYLPARRAMSVDPIRALRQD